MNGEVMVSVARQQSITVNRRRLRTAATTRADLGGSPLIAVACCSGGVAQVSERSWTLVTPSMPSMPTYMRVQPLVIQRWLSFIRAASGNS